MDTPLSKNKDAVERGRLGGLKGGAARAASLTPQQRKRIASLAAKALWAERRKMAINTAGPSGIRREIASLSLKSEGLTNKEIGLKVGVSTSTVKRTKYSLFEVLIRLIETEGQKNFSE